MTKNHHDRAELLAAYRLAGEEMATVLLPTPSRTGDAEERLRIHKKNAIGEIRRAGASEELIAAAEMAVGSIGHGDGTGRVLLIGPGGVLLDRSLVRPIVKLAVRVGVLPMLIPLLGATQADQRHLAVLIDRTGADVLLRDGVNTPLDEFEIDGSDTRVHRGHPGGWSQKRFQQTAENAWENNAKEVVDQVVEEYPDVDLLIYGGDVRAAGFFAEHLPARIDPHLVDGARHADHGVFLDHADVVLRDLAARSLVAMFENWRTATANGSGVTGEETLQLLMQGRVATLMVVDDSDTADRPSASFDFERHLFLPEVQDGPKSPITDGAIALAVATGAKVVIVPKVSDISHGIAGILRD